MKTAYLITKGNLSAIHRMIETEWKPAGYRFAIQTVDTIYKINERYNIIGRCVWQHPNSKRINFDRLEQLQADSDFNIVTIPSQLIQVE